MAAADSGSGAGGEIAGRTSSWCALWAAEGAEGREGEEGREGAEGREGEEGREGAEEGAEEGAARRAIEAAVERAAWLTGLSPAHAEECQVVTPPEPDSHPTPSSRPHPRASLHPPCTHPPPPRARWCTTRPARSTATTSTTSPLRTRASASAWARRHVQAKGHRGPPRAAEGPPRATEGALHMLHQCQRMARVAPGLGQPRPIRLASGAALVVSAPSGVLAT